MPPKVFVVALALGVLLAIVSVSVRPSGIPKHPPEPLPPLQGATYVSVWRWQQQRVVLPFDRPGWVGTNSASPAEAFVLLVQRFDGSGADWSRIIAALRWDGEDAVELQNSHSGAAWARYQVRGQPGLSGDTWRIPVHAEFAGPEPRLGVPVRVAFFS